MKIGIISKGNHITSYISAAKKCLDVEVLGVFLDQNEEAEIEKKDKIKRHEDFKSLLNDERIDTIYIDVPMDQKVHYAEQALAAKKHVVIDDPLVSSVQEMKNLLEVGEKNHCFIFEGISTIHYPNFKRIKGVLTDEDQITEVVVHSQQEISKSKDLDFQNGTAESIHFAVGLFGKPLSVDYLSHKEIELNYKGFKCLCTIGESAPFAVIKGHKLRIDAKGSFSICDEVEIEKGEKNQKRYFVDTMPNPLMHQIVKHQEIIRRNDEEAYRLLLNQAMDVLEVIEKI